MPTAGLSLHPVRRRSILDAAIVALTIALLPSRGAAQMPAGSGFLMGAPDGSLTLRGGWAVALARSDIFSFTTDNLTLNRGDFSSPTIDADLAFRVRPRMELVFSAGFAGMNKASEFRRLIDNNNQPIEQRTAFDRIPVTISIKQYLVDPGRSIGRLAWVPARLAPYVGVGGGMMWYRFRQTGDFVDFQNNNVFNAILESSGWTSTAHGLVGDELTFNPRFALVSEARYTWSKAKLGGDFLGFDSIDLSGLSATAGIAVRF